MFDKARRTEEQVKEWMLSLLTEVEPLKPLPKGDDKDSEKVMEEKKVSSE